MKAIQASKKAPKKVKRLTAFKDVIGEEFLALYHDDVAVARENIYSLFQLKGEEVFVVLDLHTGKLYLQSGSEYMPVAYEQLSELLKKGGKGVGKYKHLSEKNWQRLSDRDRAREIEAYHHPQAVQRLYPTNVTPPDFEAYYIKEFDGENEKSVYLRNVGEDTWRVFYAKRFGGRLPFESYSCSEYSLKEMLTGKDRRTKSGTVDCCDRRLGIDEVQYLSAFMPNEHAPKRKHALALAADESGEIEVSAYYWKGGKSVACADEEYVTGLFTALEEIARCSVELTFDEEEFEPALEEVQNEEPEPEPEETEIEELESEPEETEIEEPEPEPEEAEIEETEPEPEEVQIEEPEPEPEETEIEEPEPEPEEAEIEETEPEPEETEIEEPEPEPEEAETKETVSGAVETEIESAREAEFASQEEQPALVAAEQSAEPTNSGAEAAQMPEQAVEARQLSLLNTGQAGATAIAQEPDVEAPQVLKEEAEAEKAPQGEAESTISSGEAAEPAPTEKETEKAAPHKAMRVPRRKHMRAIKAEQTSAKGAAVRFDLPQLISAYAASGKKKAHRKEILQALENSPLIVPISAEHIDNTQTVYISKQAEALCGHRIVPFVMMADKLPLLPLEENREQRQGVRVKSVLNRSKTYIPVFADFKTAEQIFGMNELFGVFTLKNILSHISHNASVQGITIHPSLINLKIEKEEFEN